MSTLLPDSKGQTLKGATILRLPSVILECQSWWKGEVILKKDDNGEAVGGIQGEEALSGISVALSYWLFTKILHIHSFFFLNSEDENCCPLKICLISYEISVSYACDSNTNKGLMAFITSSTEGILMGIHESQTKCFTNIWKQTVVEHIALPSRGCLRKLNTMAYSLWRKTAFQMAVDYTAWHR